MIKSVNGDRGSSVIPVTGDDWMFIGRGKHVWLDNNSVHMNGLSGNTLLDGINASGTAKTNSIKSTSSSMRLVLLEKIDNSEDYVMHCEAGWAI